MTRSECLAAAKKCVCGDREQDYGSPENNFKLIASLWEAYIKARCVPQPEGVGIGPDDVAAMMALLKIARIAGGSENLDNWVDLAGYAACGAELQTPPSVYDPAKHCDHHWVYWPKEMREPGIGPYVCTECGMSTCAEANDAPYLHYEREDKPGSLLEKLLKAISEE